MADQIATIRTLCQALNGKYQAWLEIRSAGIESMFVRMHLRAIRRIVDQIEELAAASTSPPTLKPETTRQIEQIKIECIALDQFIAARRQQQSILECLTGLPEFRLLEIDQALAETVDPNALEVFDEDMGDSPQKAE